MNPWNTYTDWDEFARTCLANSERWFPHLHDDAFGLVVHMTLGLAGEAGELVEAAGSPFADADAMALEVADVVTYACDIAAALGCTIRPNLAPLAGLPSTDAIVAAAGKIANIVKKANRDTAGPMTYLRDHQHEIGELVGCIITEAEFMAYDGVRCRFSLGQGRRSFSLAAALDKKIAICEERWG